MSELSVLVGVLCVLFYIRVAYLVSLAFGMLYLLHEVDHLVFGMIYLVISGPIKRILFSLALCPSHTRIDWSHHMCATIFNFGTIVGIFEFSDNRWRIKETKYSKDLFAPLVEFFQLEKGLVHVQESLIFKKIFLGFSIKRDATNGKVSMKASLI